MKNEIRFRLLAILLLGIVGTSVQAAPPSSRAADAVSDAESAKLAERVKAETRHAWQGYKRYAWGHDALKPLSQASHDWYAQSLLMTPVDALDTLILMGLD
ncbi:MAG TPA: glycoside hydrolase family 47 protein, partial [Lysobacter sp.]